MGLREVLLTLLDAPLEPLRPPEPAAPHPAGAPAPPSFSVELAARVAALEVTVARLPGLWDEAAERRERAASREEAALAKRTRKKPRSDEGDPDDGEAAGLRDADGEGSAASGVLPLRARVEPPADPLASIRAAVAFTNKAI